MTLQANQVLLNDGRVVQAVVLLDINGEVIDGLGGSSQLPPQSQEALQNQVLLTDGKVVQAIALLDINGNVIG